MKPSADFSYITSKDGLTSVMPNTVAAETEYNRIFADGVVRLMPREFAAFKAQARAAGYSVRKSIPALSIDDLALELEEVSAPMRWTPETARMQRGGTVGS